jgi:hypothetical protein
MLYATALPMLNATLLPNQIRKKMVEIMTQEASTSDYKELVNKFIAGSIGQDITKATKGIYPMQVRCRRGWRARWLSFAASMTWVGKGGASDLL